MRVRPVVAGAATYVPGLYERLRGPTGGSVSASYCYGVWLKHLAIARSNGMQDVPRTIAELGPGDSLGVGLAALLSGASRYLAFDVMQYAHNDRNGLVCEELVDLLKARAPTPDRDGWPPVQELMDERCFPSEILTEQVLARALEPGRVRAVQEALTRLGASSDGQVSMRYVVPWDDRDGPPDESVDLILSHSVMEHVTDVSAAYSAMYRWLRPGGMASHQIDFQSHGLADEWNGHWAYSDRIWKVIVGRRPYLLNRQPLSVHLTAMTAAGFDVRYAVTDTVPTGIPRRRLARRWRDLSETDLTCRGALVQAVRP